MENCYDGGGGRRPLHDVDGNVQSQSTRRIDEDELDVEMEDAIISRNKSKLKSIKNAQKTSTTTTTSDSNLDVEIFIDLVRSFPCLWNIKLSAHKDLMKRKNAWEQISAALEWEIFG